MLESLQLFRFMMTEQRIDIPAIKRIQTDSSSSNEKAAMFLKIVEENPDVLAALRKAKKDLDKSGPPSTKNQYAILSLSAYFLFPFIRWWWCYWTLTE